MTTMDIFNALSLATPFATLADAEELSQLLPNATAADLPALAAGYADAEWAALDADVDWDGFDEAPVPDSAFGYTPGEDAPLNREQLAWARY